MHPLHQGMLPELAGAEVLWPVVGCRELRHAPAQQFWLLGRQSRLQVARAAAALLRNKQPQVVLLADAVHRELR